MKTKKVIVVLAVLLFSTVFVVSASNASQWYYSLDVVKIGVSSGPAYLLHVKNSAGTWQLQRYLDTTVGNELLAIILTAQSQGSQIHIYHDTVSDKITGVVLSNE
ncbi:MAG: hypothetical protein JW920_01535 [Deltaproteobacteria bacterium]|nr:hypothetical protein [Deltaproteobacteria bacterium]